MVFAVSEVISVRGFMSVFSAHLSNDNQRCRTRIEYLVTSIFVGNLANSTSERDLRSTFERFGRVSSVRVIHDRQTGSPRGFAFVGMPSWEDADEAIVRLNGSSLTGRQIVVNHAQSASRAAVQTKHMDPFLARLMGP